MPRSVRGNNLPGAAAAPATGPGQVIHRVCLDCDTVLACSEPQRQDPPSAYGWCRHGGGAPVAVFDDFGAAVAPTSLHHCNGRLRAAHRWADRSADTG
ncbi:hypothetical protein GHK86_02540 [Acidimicrobiaceae bacterium USS-CC1]|uniref:Uncharacterized protein n=1 Tax=Acidiferrimicrobium australe TaxID=2664430 RepID=A0ABW9QQ20_9ACTN|nr:hypothetical protein [Acidiferrimicrobium australe]